MVKNLKGEPTGRVDYLYILYQMKIGMSNTEKITSINESNLFIGVFVLG